MSWNSKFISTLTDARILDASNCLSLSAFDVSRVLEGGVQLNMCDAKTFDLPVNPDDPVNQGGLMTMTMMVIKVTATVSCRNNGVGDSGDCDVYSSSTPCLNLFQMSTTRRDWWSRNNSWTKDWDWRCATPSRSARPMPLSRRKISWWRRQLRLLPRWQWRWFWGWWWWWWWKSGLSW